MKCALELEVTRAVNAAIKEREAEKERELRRKQIRKNTEEFFEEIGSILEKKANEGNSINHYFYVDRANRIIYQSKRSSYVDRRPEAIFGNQIDIKYLEELLNEYCFSLEPTSFPIDIWEYGWGKVKNNGYIIQPNIPCV